MERLSIQLCNLYYYFHPVIDFYYFISSDMFFRKDQGLLVCHDVVAQIGIRDKRDLLHAVFDHLRDIAENRCGRTGTRTTAASFAALRMQGMLPPVPMARYASPRFRKTSLSGSSNVSDGYLAKSKRRKIRLDAIRVCQAHKGSAVSCQAVPSGLSSNHP